MAAQQMGDFMTASTAVIARNGDLALAGPLGSLDAYLDRVGRIPVLTRDEERDLAEGYRSGGDLDAARHCPRLAGDRVVWKCNTRATGGSERIYRQPS